MKKSVSVTYEIVNPGRKGALVAQTIIDELKRMQNLVDGAIDTVVINWSQAGKVASLSQKYEKKFWKLSDELQVGKFFIKQDTSSIPAQSNPVNEESRTPQEILEDLRRLHDGLTEIEIDEDLEDAKCELESIYVEMETRLDELEEVLKGDGSCDIKSQYLSV